MSERETIVLTIEQVAGGYYIDSQDLPELNVFVKAIDKVVTAVPEAIKYLYRHNRGMDVRVFMEVPVFPDSTQECVELQPLPLAA